MLKHFLSLICVGLVYSHLHAQTNAGISACATDELHQTLLQTDSQYAADLELQEQQYRTYVQKFRPGGIDTRSIGLSSCNDIIYLPIVFHVIHLGEPIGTGSNISDAGVIAAVNGMNQRLRNLNGAGTDMKIQFVLAKRDPNGNPTTGINRVDGSPIPNFASEGISWDGSGGASQTEIKDLSRWPIQQYYNVWLVHKIYGSVTSGGQIGGYANYPTVDYDYDGAVVDVNFMSAGSTVLIHEIGHGFNLRHTFDGDNGSICPPDNNCLMDGDRICDTPPHRVNDCGSNNPCSSSGNWNSSRKNYMSYCGNTNQFTEGQRLRVEAAILLGNRAPLLESEAIIAVDQPREVGILEMLYPKESAKESFCTSGFSPRLMVKNYGTAVVNHLIFISKIDGIAVGSSSFSGTLTSGSSLPIVLEPVSVPAGTHSFEVELVVVNGESGDAFSGNNKACGSFTFENQREFPFCNDFETVAFPTAWHLFNPETEIATLDFPRSGATDHSLVIKNYDATGGSLNKKVSITTQVLDLRGAVSAGVSFDLAMRELFICNTAVSLDVEVSTDCGQTFNSLYHRNNARTDCPGYPPTAHPLHTVARPPDTNPPLSSFVPDDSSHWRRDFVNLSAYAGQEILVRFSISTNFFTGENLYLDNICVSRCTQANVLDIQFSTLPSYDDNGSAKAVVSGGQAPYTYIWSAHPDRSVDSISQLSPGNYLLTVIDANSCMATDSVTIDDHTGIPPLPASLREWKVFPNPFNQGITIDLSFDRMTSMRLALFDFQGRKLWSRDAGDIVQFTYSLETSSLSEGIYFLSILTSDGILRVPILKRP